MRGKILCITIAAFFCVLLLPRTAMADNCGDVTDCYRVLIVALLAVLAVLLFIVLLPLLPGILAALGEALTAVGIIEAATGRSVITGDKLALWERMLGIIPFGKLDATAIRAAEKYIPVGGIKIFANPNKTTTILGRWEDEMRYIRRHMLEADLNVGNEFSRLTSNKGGFNMLDIPDELAKIAGKDFFDINNKPWLEAAIRRGDDIAIATQLENRYKVVDLALEPIGNFGKELKYLVERNYKPKNITNAEWEAIKSWF